MQKQFRLFDMGRGEADNIAVVNNELNLFVYHIEWRTFDGITPLVIVTSNPNLVEYRESPDRQSLGFQATNETRITKLPKNHPVQLKANGRVYTVTVDEIGVAQEQGRRWAFADFTVSWD